MPIALHSPCPRRWLLSAAVALLLPIVGCGGGNEGPERYDVSGTVTYGEKPLGRGRITFVPDNDKGNSGPAGYALIMGGEYDTSAPGGKAAIAGPLKVLITGYDESTDSDGEAKPPLFEDYPETAEIDPAQGKTKLDFAVPASLGR